MEMWLDSTVSGTHIGTVSIDNPPVRAEDSWREVGAPMKIVGGRHALYFKFVSDGHKETICDLKSFCFSLHPLKK